MRVSGGDNLDSAMSLYYWPQLAAKQDTLTSAFGVDLLPATDNIRQKNYLGELPSSNTMGTDNGKEACNAWDYTDCKGTEYCPPRCPRFFDKNGVPLLIGPYLSTYRDALSAMYEDLDAHSKTLGLPPTTTEQREQWLDHLIGAGLNLVALDEGNVVGHVAAVPAEEDKSQLVVFVHQAYQNRGIGTELLKQLVAHADDENVEAITLMVALNNQRAITVYDNMGFDVIERMQGEIAMRLSLDRPIVDEVKRPPAEQ